MTLNTVMPNYDVREYHQTFIRASRAVVYASLKATDFRGSWLVRNLLRLRAGGKAAETVKLEQFWQTGFLLLEDRPNEEVLLGLVGRFWTPNGGRLKMAPDQFPAFNDPRYGKAVFNFLLTETPDGTLLSTETRVKFHRNPERFFFRCYWAVIRPFSGLIRLEMLRQVKQACIVNR